MTDKKIEDKSGEKPAVPTGLKRKKDLPSVDYLLKHGDPDTVHLPKTWFEIIGYPFALALVFAISLIIFHHAPDGPVTTYSLPTMNRMKMFESKVNQPRHIQKEPEKKTEL